MWYVVHLHEHLVVPNHVSILKACFGHSFLLLFFQFWVAAIRLIVSLRVRTNKPVEATFEVQTLLVSKVSLPPHLSLKETNCVTRWKTFNGKVPDVFALGLRFAAAVPTWWPQQWSWWVPSLWRVKAFVHVTPNEDHLKAFEEFVQSYFEQHKQVNEWNAWQICVTKCLNCLNYFKQVEWIKSW